VKKIIAVVLLSLVAMGARAQSAPQPQSATLQATATITPAPLVVAPWVIAGPATVPMSASMNIEGGVGPYTCTLTSGALPNGLALGVTQGSAAGVSPVTSPTCNVTGTPTTAGTYAFAITVTSTQ
jgi:hypothetical protein